jgi:uncharacterized membrane protein
MTALGILQLWRAFRGQHVLLSGYVLLGAILFGWGIFNLVEGITDHQIFQLHHVYQNGDHFLWDGVFLASAVVLILAGWLVMTRDYAAARRSLT